MTPRGAGNLPAAQQAIRTRCVHPTGRFVEFPAAAVEGSVTARFEDQARRHAGRIAVRTPARTLTYAALDLAANRVAHAVLARLGPGQEPVVLLSPKGARQIVALVGVLKAGKTYVFVDPDLPRERIAYILEDSQARLVLADPEHAALASALAAGRWLDVDALPTGLSDESPGVIVSPDAVAALSYTSGSTGRPKGVGESHQSLLHMTMTQTNDFHLCAEDRLTFLGARGGDIYRALLNGAALYPVDVKREGLAGLASWLAAECVTGYNSVVSVFRHFCETLAISAGTADATRARREGRFPALRLVKVMGEPVYRSDLELYRRHFSPACVFVNSFGSTEAQHVAHYFVDRDSDVVGSSVPVGYPINGYQVRVLDGDGRPVAAGATGEIVLTSRYLSPGYWRQPEATAAAFAVDPADPAVRTYRTGDLGEMRPDGCLVHLGRTDSQVKIRGHRIEIGEVEAALLALPEVADAVVVARTDTPGEPRLVAYFVGRDAPLPDGRALRRALAARLPDYMIPWAFVSMDALPRVGLGKVDRRALPVPPRGQRLLPEPPVAPRTPVETLLAQIWSEVLALAPVGVHDAFVDLGGHSLLAAELVVRVREAFHVDVPLRSLLESPTVAEMAIVVVEDRAARHGTDEIERVLAAMERRAPAADARRDGTATDDPASSRPA